MPPLPKTIGRYEILELVGRGGMGVLYRAHDPMLERDVALKTMLVDFTLDQAARERFEREAKAVARLQHRNVVTIHELGETDGTPYIVMEFLGGKDLDAWLSVEPARSLASRLDVVIQLCEGLAYAHEQGIVHRDIKPGNVRVLEDGTVKILDFGIAKFAKSSLTQTGTMMGTASYMAPEQIMGQAVDGRADLFSVGVLLHELVSGEKPFNGESPTAVVYQIMHVEPAPVLKGAPDLPEALNDIVTRALKKDPDERYARASEMASDLQMVKMMLDPPLTTGAAPAGTPEATMLRSAKLHATTIGTKPKTNSPVAVDAPLHPGPKGGPIAAPPTVAGGKTGLIVGVAAAVVVVAIVGLWGLRGHGSGPAPVPKAAGTAAAATGAAAAPRAAAATLLVSSVPSGAQIVVNGTDTGKETPAVVPIPGGMPGTVELSLKGYQPLSATVSADDLREGKREFRLTREAGPVKLTMSGSYPFEIVQGGRVVSKSAKSHSITLQPGGGSVVARSAEYLLNQPVSIDFQRAASDIAVPAPGLLDVFSAVETCSIVVDGTDLGFPPIARKPIAAGSHKVTLKCPDGKDDSKTVSVSAGEHQQVKFLSPG